MLARLATTLVIALLRVTHLSLEDRSRLTGALLTKLQAIPASDIISTNEEGRLTVYGRPLDLEEAQKLRESAKYVLDSSARKLARETVAFRAVTLGVHNGDTNEKIFFSRAALWQAQQEDELYRTLAQE